VIFHGIFISRLKKLVPFELAGYLDPFVSLPIVKLE